MEALKFQYVIWALVLGVFLTLLTGLLPNEPRLSIPEIRRYGYPLSWLVTNLNGPTSCIVTSFIVDILFWSVISFIFILLLIVAKAKIRVSSKYGLSRWFFIGDVKRNRCWEPEGWEI